MSGVLTQPAVLLHPAWWAGGLTLAERCALNGLPSATEDAERLARAGRRIDRWRVAHRLGHSGQFGRQLDEAGLDGTVLTALLAEERTGLAARAVEPAWAGHVRAVLDGSASWPELPLGESLQWEAGFAAFAAPFVRPAAGRLSTWRRSPGWSAFASEPPTAPPRPVSSG